MEAAQSAEYVRHQAWEKRCEVCGGPVHWLVAEQAWVHQSEGSAVPVCKCGHRWDDHSDHGERCLVCACPAAEYVAVPEGGAGQEDAALRGGGATASPSGLLSIPDPINDFTPEQRAALEAHVSADYGRPRPRLLDLFCGAGGAAMGYWRAGFDVVGVDIKDQPDYPFEFHRADAMTYPLDGYDVLHASPPCQDHSSLRNGHDEHGTGWMLEATVIRFCESGKAWVCENVVGPDVHMAGWWFVLCGSMFDLKVRRHRRFGSSHLMMPPVCRHDLQPITVDVTGHSANGSKYRLHERLGLPIPGGLAERREAMGIDWMRDRDALSQAIPPAYTEWIAGQLLDARWHRAVAARIDGGVTP